MSKNEHGNSGEYLKRGQALAIMIGGFGALVVPAWLILAMMVHLSDVPTKVDQFQKWQQSVDVWRAQVSERLGLPQPTQQSANSKKSGTPSVGFVADMVEPNQRLSIPAKTVE